MKKYDYLRIINDGIEWLLLWTLSGAIFLFPILTVYAVIDIAVYKITDKFLPYWFAWLFSFVGGIMNPYSPTPTKIKAKYKEVVEKLKIYFEKYKI